MLPALFLSVVALIAGKPATAACDADTTNPFPFAVDGWTYPGDNLIHLSSKICAFATFKPGSKEFAVALNVTIHESAHARGVKSEACAELWADAVDYMVLRNIFHIPFFSPQSWLIGQQVLDYTHLKPTSYQPNGQSCA